ncbi:MAG: electron transfer flavoprotein subunit beta/FixA family protein [Desulfamplus sp.]|nr:electron transfer flavoprotein subunit beta/FixA family protein [Desulfamplus sp.]
MKIFVCVKHVPDSAATIVVRDKKQIDEKITFLLNPYDEYAVTEAVKLKKSFIQKGVSSSLGQAQQSNQIEIIAVSIGTSDAEKTVRSAMEMGADRGILITTENRHQDSITTAKALKAAIEQDCSPQEEKGNGVRVVDSGGGELGIIFTGKESIDMGGMQTMFRLGAYFNFPVVNNIVKFTPDIENWNLESNKINCDQKVVVESITEGGGRDVYEITLPCVLGAGRGLNTPIYPTFPDVVKARKRPIKVIALDTLIDDLKSDKPAAVVEIIAKSGTEIIDIELFAEKRTPKQIKGNTSQIAKEIVRILKEEVKII